MQVILQPEGEFSSKSTGSNTNYVVPSDDGCRDCSTLRILAAILPTESIRKILECLGLPSRATPIARAVPEGADEPELF
ncbi:MAG: hypothetical protein DMG08_19995 [Acidobacteria bacterium]|nr:MAG: hypothetical protein DMG08_19995 [Acidobacteriota bacterium]